MSFSSFFLASSFSSLSFTSFASAITSSAETLIFSTVLSIDSLTFNPPTTVLTAAFFASFEFKTFPPIAPAIIPAPTLIIFFVYHIIPP